MTTSFTGTWVVFITIGLGTPAGAQTVSTATIDGIIRDGTGLGVPSAVVKAVQTSTGAVRSVATGTDGTYRLQQLAVGPYRIEVAKPGFATHIQTGIVLQVASNPALDIVLAVGAITEQVTVAADAGMVETQSPGIGQVVDSKRIMDLPLIGRNVADLISLSGAATLSPNPQLNTSRNYSTPALSLAGGLGSGTTYLVDGSMHNDPSNGLALPLPFPETLQEFKVETGALPAQYGLHSAGAVNVVTKSGTNELHGDAFWYVRNYRFNARNFFATKRDSLKRNQFGGAAGGPVIRDKLFVFAGYQGTISRQDGITNTMFIPTEASLKGDFTSLASAACNGGVSRTLRAPFVGNRVAPSLFSAPALRLASNLPAATDPCGRITFGVGNISEDRQALARVDYRKNDRHTLFARYLAAQFAAPNPYSLELNVLATGAANGASFGQDILAQSVTIGYTQFVTPRSSNSLRGTFNRSAVQRIGSRFFSGPDLGINMHTYFPKFLAVIATGSFTVGTPTSTDATYNTNTYQGGDDFSLARGKHQISLGASMARWNAETFAGVFGAGTFTFSGGMTGNALADLMLGNAASFQQGAPAGLFTHQDYAALYAQDSWRLARGLVLTYGVRWEPHLPAEIEDGHIGHIDVNAFLEGRRTTIFKNAPDGIFYPGDPGFPSRSSVRRHWLQFAPRVGLAWSPKGDGRLSIRASYGIFYDFLPAHTHLNTIAINPWVGRTTIASVNFANPWENQPGGNPFPLPPSNADSPFAAGGSFVNWDYDMRPTYVQSRNISIQKQIGANWLLSASYLGSQTTHLLSPQALNPAKFLGDTAVCTVNGITINSCNTPASNAQRRRLSLLRPSQGRFFGDIVHGDFGGTGSYNALLLLVHRRFDRGVTLNANYTWSHCISDYVYDASVPAGQQYTNPDDRSLDRGNCNTSASDRRHLINVVAIFETPGFSNRWMDHLAGRWRVSTIVVRTSGPWLNVTTGSVDAALSGIANQRANQVGAGIYGPGFRQYLNPSAFALPATGARGNLGAGSIVGPGAVTVNMGLSRIFRLREKHMLEIRAEASNLLNSVNLGNPNTSVGTSSFGQITSTAGGAGLGFVAPGDPRIVQFVSKYIF